jgi:hypothetical protein
MGNKFFNAGNHLVRLILPILPPSFLLTLRSDLIVLELSYFHMSSCCAKGHILMLERISYQGKLRKY